MAQKAAAPRYHSRLGDAAFDWQGRRARIEQLIDLAIRGLPKYYTGGKLAHTVRRIETEGGDQIAAEGENLRYAAITALGLAYMDEATQRACLNGSTAAALAEKVAKRTAAAADPGSVALAAWAAAEVAGSFEEKLFARLKSLVTGQAPIETVVCSWILSAALAARRRGDAELVAITAAGRLMGAQARSGLFPHLLPASALGRLRAHVSCFADQVYPIQALARYAVVTGNTSALKAAGQSAARICALQGQAGQWWWHYDVRNGEVVEGYPVYSVHQHAMGPMALFDLLEAGGPDYRPAIVKGIAWLDERPENPVELVSERHGVIWRKIARREPPKFTRSLSAVTTALVRGFRIPGLDLAFPPGEVDYECRPYEFGWLLYAWLAGGVVSELAPRQAAADV